ncbi:MAG: inositol monophosphatase family protein [Candidatus Dormibacteraceae bacterium]
MNDEEWVHEFHRIAELVRGAVTPLLGTAEGRRELGRGAGGDRTVVLDQAAEDVVLRELRTLATSGESCTVISEEAGEIGLGAPYPRIFVDPVDGSLNAKYGLPQSGVMLSLFDGPLLGDIRAGVVQSLASGERWHAIRGGGAFHDGRRVQPRSHPGDRIQVLGVEGSPRQLESVWPLVRSAGKLRCMGSIALSLAYTATGVYDAFCSPKQTGRAFDMTAGMLMIEEAGGIITDLQGGAIAGARAGLHGGTALLAAPSREAHALALEKLAG